MRLRQQPLRHARERESAASEFNNVPLNARFVFVPREFVVRRPSLKFLSFQHFYNRFEHFCKKERSLKLK